MSASLVEKFIECLKTATPEQIVEIRGLLQLDKTVPTLPSRSSSVASVKSSSSTGSRGAKPGSQHYNAVLTEQDVLFIRATYRWGKGKVLAEQYGVTPGAISAIVTRRSWKHL